MLCVWDRIVDHVWRLVRSVHVCVCSMCVLRCICVNKVTRDSLYDLFQQDVGYHALMSCCAVVLGCRVVQLLHCAVVF